VILGLHSALRRRVQRTRARSGAVILLYHRVAEPGLDPWGLAVSPKHFEEHLEVLGRRGPSLTLSALVEALKSGQLQKSATAITFDDGYADNLHVAMPLLERHNKRATVFLTTGPIIRQGAFWWDELEEILLCRAALPRRKLELLLPAGTFTWTLEEHASQPLPEISRWRAWQPVSPCRERQALYVALWQLLQELPHGPRQKALEALRHWAGGEAVPRSAHRPLTVQEVAALADGDLIEVGAHTVNHPALASISIKEQREEIIRSKADVEGIIGAPVRGFSYPHGSCTKATATAVRAAGFAYACVAAPTPLTSATVPFKLPRITVSNCDGDSFARELMVAVGPA
jgi:peptidoglycan/xylan/chitin deacetylase (PgdA/CDA1 family)